MTQDSEPKPRLNPCWISAFEAFTDGLPTPPIFRKWAGISAVAGALERRTWITTSAGALYPNLFVLMVAPPGVGKDQAINPMRELWAATGKLNIAPISMTHKGFIDQLADKAITKTMVDSLTGKMVKYQSLLLPVPELGVLLPKHDLGFLSALNDLYNCYPVYEERIRMTGEILQIVNPHIHIISGTQPKYLGELFPEAAYGMGFTSRIIMIYAGTPIRVPLFVEQKTRKDLQKTLIEDLNTIASLQGEFKLEPEAIEMIEHWHAYESDKTKPTHSKLQHYNARRILHILKLCMAFSASRSNELLVSAGDFLAAKQTLAEAETYMPEVFKEISAGGQGEVIEEAFNFLVAIFMRTKKPVPEAKLIHFLSAKVPANQISFLIDTMLKAEIITDVTAVSGLNLPDKFMKRLFAPSNLQGSTEI